MMTYDVDGIQQFTANLSAKIAGCENGEGMECATLDAALSRHADICCEFVTAVREWAHDVFTGKIPFDPEAERVWREQGEKLYYSLLEWVELGKAAEAPCYQLDGGSVILWPVSDLAQILKNWVSPRLAVSPAARHLPGVEEIEGARNRLETLPALPAEWRPENRQQAAMFRRLRRS